MTFREGNDLRTLTKNIKITYTTNIMSICEFVCLFKLVSVTAERIGK